MTSILDLVRQKQEKINSDKLRGMRTFKIPPGDTVLRILPSWAGEGEQFWHDWGQHFIKVNPNQDKPDAVYMCAEKTYEKECAICSTVRQAMANTDDDKERTALKENLAQKKYLLNVLVRTDKGRENDVQVVEIGQTIFDSILALFSEWGDITHLTDGTDIKVTRTGSGFDTKYTLMPTRTSAAVAEDVLTRLVDLNSMVKQESEEKLRMAMNKIGAVIGVLPPAGAVPASRSLAASLGSDDMDEIEDGDVLEIEVPKAVEPVVAKVAEPALGADDAPFETDDEDIEALLAEIS